MATKVIVKQFGGAAIGVITYGAQGELVVAATQPGVQVELESLVNAITSQPLTAISGRIEAKEGQQMHETIALPVLPGEPRYLLALADAITRARHKIAGKRVRAFIQAVT